MSHVKTYTELFDLVKIDSENHHLKDIAEFFLVAMNDWPTQNLDLIETFISELKDFFGAPLTLEKIDSKKIDFNVKNNSWRSESGSSIAEMLEYSKLYYNETNFENIVFKIIEYYSNQRASS